MVREGQVNINFIVGLVLIMTGILAVTFMGLGFMFRDSNLVWVGTIVLMIMSLISAILEKVLLR